jgi:Flp pilus assembly protein CpaB
MRAVTVEVNESSGGAGLLVQGCRVDVVATLRKGDETVSRTIVENVKVAAVDGRLVKEKGAAQGVRTITLFVSPKNAEAIELASNNGRPRLVLRNAGDNTPTGSPGMTLAELIGGIQPAATAPASDAFAPPQQQGEEPTTRPAVADAGFQNSFVRRPVQIIRGGAESTIYYEVRAGSTQGPAVASNPNIDNSTVEPELDAVPAHQKGK